LLAKYDLNQNGVIDPDEREAALDDPAFIESQLDVIDANQNGQLDLAELAYFDANHDRILEPKEEAGIGIALHLLAKRDLDRFDTSGTGTLDEQDFERLLRSNPDNPFIINVVFQKADENHDGKIELDELESCLKYLLRQQLHPVGINNAAIMNQLQLESNPAKAAQEVFKLEVENYWRNPASITHRPPYNGRPPLGAFPSPRSWPPGPPQ
jgi:Ca2+-binding EF-hand superfamily protein